MNSYALPEYLPRFDAEGFLAEPDRWNESLARRIATFDGLGELDARQWSVVRALRNEFSLAHVLPAPHHACRLAGQDSGCMHTLFPGAREVWRLAGLPDPGEEARAYL